MICSYDLMISYFRCEFFLYVGVAKNRRFFDGVVTIQLQYFHTYISELLQP